LLGLVPSEIVRSSGILTATTVGIVVWAVSWFDTWFMSVVLFLGMGMVGARYVNTASARAGCASARIVCFR